MPFSSRHRWSALDLGDERLVLGAPERLLGRLAVAVVQALIIVAGSMLFFGVTWGTRSAPPQ